MMQPAARLCFILWNVFDFKVLEFVIFLTNCTEGKLFEQFSGYRLLWLSCICFNTFTKSLPESLFVKDFPYGFFINLIWKHQLVIHCFWIERNILRRPSFQRSSFKSIHRLHPSARNFFSLMKRLSPCKYLLIRKENFNLWKLKWY